MWRSHNSCIDAIHAVRQFIYTRCRQSRRIKINRADDIRPYGQYITFSYSIVGGGASTPRKNRQLSIENRSSEGIVIARAFTPVAIRTPCRHKAARCFAPQENGFPRLLLSLGMTTGGILPPVFILICRQRRHHNFPLSIVNCQFISAGNTAVPLRPK